MENEWYIEALYWSIGIAINIFSLLLIIACIYILIGKWKSNLFFKSVALIALLGIIFAHIIFYEFNSNL